MYGFHGNGNLAILCITVITTVNAVAMIVRYLGLSLFSSYCLQYFSEKLSFGTLKSFSLLFYNIIGKLEKTTSRTEMEAQKKQFSFSTIVCHCNKNPRLSNLQRKLFHQFRTLRILALRLLNLVGAFVISCPMAEKKKT